jgi:type VI secretion system protein ImpL
MEGGFAMTDTTRAVREAVRSFVLQPIRSVEPQVAGAGGAKLNKDGQDFCGVYSELFSKYPFTPGARTEATAAEVTAMFHPERGQLRQFYNDAASKVIFWEGTSVTRRPGSEAAATDAFVAFFRRVAEFAGAMFRDGSAEPLLVLRLRGIPDQGISAITVRINETVQSFDAAHPSPTGIRWTVRDDGTARLSGRIGDGSQEFTFQSFTGRWALFRLFDSAEQWSVNGNLHTATWAARMGGQAIRTDDSAQPRVMVELDPVNVPLVLRREYLASLRCVGRMVTAQ